jgi:hypothetical protein
LPASDPKFCAPANIAENFSKLFFRQRIDTTQPLNCEKWGKPTVFMAALTTAALNNDGVSVRDKGNVTCRSGNYYNWKQFNLEMF